MILADSDYPTVCILAAGKGTRLGFLSRSIHKALLPLGNKAVISHIIEKFPISVTFVIALGYRGNSVRDFLSVAHPERRFIFVEVDRYEGKGTGPGYSLYCCRRHLQGPFLFVACDTLVTSPLPNSRENWIGVQKVGDVRQWCSAELDDFDHVTALHYKTPANTDMAFVGLASVRNYAKFWVGLERSVTDAGELQVNGGLAALIPEGLKAVRLEWKDTGTEQSYRELSEQYGVNLTFQGKTNEFTYQYGRAIVKSFDDTALAQGRVQRAESLGAPLPRILSHCGGVFSYAYQEGTLLSEIINHAECSKFLSWMSSHFWEARKMDDTQFDSALSRFYVEKTLNRLGALEKVPVFAAIEAPVTINGRICPPVREMVRRAWSYLSGGGLASTYHGDLHSDNIIKSANEYSLIDWRHAFGDLVDVGDRYYDLAKFLHTLDFSVRSMSQGQFRIRRDGDVVVLNHSVEGKEMEARTAFFEFVEREGYDPKRIKIINSLIFINMAPLYLEELSQYLYYLGRYCLQLSLSED